MSRKECKLADAEELALIARLRACEPSALTTIFERYGTAMTTLAASMLRDQTEADDVVEEALLRIHAAGASFRGERGLRTWVLRIAANLCRDRLRRRKFTAPLPHPDHEDPFAAAGLTFDPSAAMDEEIDGKVLMAALERAIAALPQDQCEAVVMRHRLGLSYAEMTEVLDVPEGTVKSRLARALGTLRQAMEEYR
ncbi:MAG: RNA polymerase sigma factor [Candidatus Eisenbacteria bacterium]